VGWDFPFQRFQVFLCRVFAHMEVVFLSMLGSHQLKSIPILCNGFVSLEQVVVHDTLLILPNTEHKLGAMDIRFCHGYCMVGLTLWFFRFGLWQCIHFSSPVTIRCKNPLRWSNYCNTWKNGFPDLLTSIHTVRHFLAFESFPMLLNAWKCVDWVTLNDSASFFCTWIFIE